MTESRSTPYSSKPMNLLKGRRTQPLSNLSSTERIVRKRLADGTVKEYHYPRNRKITQPKIPEDSLQAMLMAYRRSPKWNALRPNSKAHYTHYLRHLEMAWHKPLSQITRRLLLDMRDAVAAKYGPSAGNCFIKVSSAAFTWGKKQGYLEHSPIDHIEQIQTGNFPAWTNEQVTIAMRTFPEALRRAIVLGIYTGQRRSDLVAMKWTAYNDGVIRVKQIKTDTELVVPVHSALRVELDRWWQERPGIGGATILTSPRGVAWSGTWLSTSFAEAVRNSGLPARLNVHGLRKLAAANLAEAGCSVLEIAAITGHSSLAMIALYTKSADQRKLAQQAIARLETRHSETA